MMKSKAAICILCLALTTASGALPHRNGLKQAALHLLEWTEEKGGQILSEVILGKKVQDGSITFSPVVFTDFEGFLQELSSKLTQLEAEASTLHTAAALAGNSGHTIGKREVVIPPETRLASLDYNDILDILGDYTKGFVLLIQPMLLPLFHKKDLDSALPGQDIQILLNSVLSQIQQARK